MSKVVKLPAALMAMCIAALVVASLFPEREAPAEVRAPIEVSPDVRESIDAQAERIDAELSSLEEMEPIEAAPEPKREVRRWRWESPEATREKLWHIPESESNEAAATAFLRVCLAEADGHEADCVGIWQVISNVRSRSCRRAIKTITECDADGETMLSAMRRAAKHVTGGVPPRTYRQQWISEVELSCEEPDSWPTSSELWQSQYGNRRCPRVAQLARDLAAGTSKVPWTFTGVRPIAWGGRCEDSRGACDDHIACSRGLARIPSSTPNAFWRRAPAGYVDPICQGKRLN